jgi:hypothetical protein
MKTTFTVTEDHIKLLKAAHVDWDDCEFGAPAIDPKRPYGNSSVFFDIAEIIGIQPSDDYDESFTREEEDRMRELHYGTRAALQIFLCTGKMETGTYEKEGYGKDWKKVK